MCIRDSTNALIDTPFLMKTAETIRLGTGIPQIFNDEVVVPAFLNRGVLLEGLNTSMQVNQLGYPN